MLVRLSLVVLVGLVAVACSSTPAANTSNNQAVDVAPSTIPAESFHIDLLEGSPTNLGNTWSADVTVTLVDSSGQPVVGATVTGTWSVDETVEQDCQTGTTGQCQLVSEPIRKNFKHATLSIEGVEHPSLVYRPANDHDPDPNTDGTSVTVGKT